MLLVLDTAAGGVAIAAVAAAPPAEPSGAGQQPGARVLAARSAPDDRRHVERLLPMLDEVLRELSVDQARPGFEAVLVGVGPGAYTGLRVGVTTGLALGLAWQVPVHGACSLDALAVHALATGAVSGPCVVVTDARRRQVFWARYDADGRRLGEPAVCDPDEVPTDAPVVRTTPANAAAWLGLGVLDGLITTVPPQPWYLRRPDARPPGPPKSVLPSAQSMGQGARPA